MDTIYAEGQRRYVESLSAYARQFVGQMQKPQGRPHRRPLAGHRHRAEEPGQHAALDRRHGHRDLRLPAHPDGPAGPAHCPDCDMPVGTQTVDEIVDKIMAEPEGTRLYLMAPVEIEVGQKYESLWDEIRAAATPRPRRRPDLRSTKPPRSTAAASTASKSSSTASSSEPDARADRRQRRERAGAGQGRDARRLCRRRRARTALAGPSTASTWPATAAAAASSRSRRTASRSTARWAGARPAKGWACRPAPIPPPAARSQAHAGRRGRRLWPNFSSRVATMLARWPRHGHSRSTCPSSNSDARQRRILMHGTGDSGSRSGESGGGRGPPAIGAGRPRGPFRRFQFNSRALPGAGRSLAPVALVPRPAGAPRRRSRVLRLRRQPAARRRAAVRFRGRTIDELVPAAAGRIAGVVEGWKLTTRANGRSPANCSARSPTAAVPARRGLDYLTLARGAATLSNGEAQRIRLASQLGSGLCGVLYVLDEPTIGLHPRDNRGCWRPAQAARPGQHAAGRRARPRGDRRPTITAATSAPAPASNGGRSSPAARPSKSPNAAGSVTGPYLAARRRSPCRPTAACPACLRRPADGRRGAPAKSA
jgi:excinuclease ABC subunit A